jgi:hypothetical protein
LRPSYRAARIAKFAVAPAALLASALAISHVSYSAFNATTNNSGNKWTAGTLQLTNDAGATALFNAANISPGDAGTKCITVSSTATTASRLKLYATDYNRGTKKLGDRINLTITGGSFPGAVPINGECLDFIPGAIVVPSTTSLTTFSAASKDYATGADSFLLPAGKSRSYKIDWTFVSAGTSVDDNPYQGDSAAIGFTWEAQPES